MMRRPRGSVRGLMLAVAFVALSIAWASRWSDFGHKGAFHAGVAAEHRVFAGLSSMTAWARDRQRGKAEWHEEMARRFGSARWLPWPLEPPAPPWTFGGDGPRLPR